MGNRGKSSVSNDLHNDRSNTNPEVSIENPNPFRALFDTMEQGVIYQDSTGKIVLVNSAAERIIGLTLGQLMGIEIIDPRWKALHEDGSDCPHSKNPSMVALKTGKPVRNKIMGFFNQVRGENRWIRVNSVPLFKNGERKPYQVCTTIDDITDAIKTEEARKTKQRELEIYADLLQHDLRNDLQLTISNIDAAEMFEDHSTDNLMKYLQSIRAASERMTHLLNAIDIVDESRETNIIAMLQNIASRSEEVHTGLKVIIKSNLKTKDVRIPSNHLLPTVFYNLIRNSVRYCGEDVVVSIRIKELDGQFLVRVSDNGPGIPESIRSKLFGKGASTNGGGLGLYLSNQIMEAYEGTISLVDSKPGEGAAFLLTLPSKWYQKGE
jgi:PAS domain S-box-containing protein